MQRDGVFLAIDLGRARMGLAVSAAGTPLALPHSVAARLCRQFALALAAAQARPVWLVDEADTTTVAHDGLRMLGMKAAKRRTQVDKFAAAVILQRFLDGAPAEQISA